MGHTAQLDNYFEQLEGLKAALLITYVAQLSKPPFQNAWSKEPPKKRNIAILFPNLPKSKFRPESNTPTLLFYQYLLILNAGTPQR
jgi:hypothetical protein